jgi:hypothetical protein
MKGKLRHGQVGFYVLFATGQSHPKKNDSQKPNAGVSTHLSTPFHQNFDLN